MSSSLINDPEHWRARAEEMRRLAEDTKDAATKEMMLRNAPIMRTSRCGPKNGQSALILRIDVRSNPHARDQIALRR
jgi:hypothetical protein